MSDVDSKENTVELSIIMPCLNEEETISQCINNASRFLSENNVNGEIIIGDNGSTDGSIELATKAGAKVVNVKEKGYGAACIGAIKEANGKYIIMGDSDLSYDFYNLMPFVNELRNKNQLVMGNRFKGGIEPGAMPFKNRYLGNPVLSFVGRFLFKSNIGDFHCGLRGFSKSAYEKMNIQSSGMEFASELVFKAQMMKMKIAEVPTTLAVDGRSRKPHLRPWRDGWRHLRLMFLFSPYHLFLVPGCLAMGIGLLLMCFIIATGSLSIGKANLSGASLVYGGAFFIVGLQALLFGFLAKYYGIREGVLEFDSKTHAFFEKYNTDHFLLIGFSILMIGIVGTIYSVVFWSTQGFGALNNISILSIVVPSTVMLVSGFEIILFGLLMGVFNLKKTDISNQS